MPYYVYAFHAGTSRISRLCGTFADYQKAEICERGNDKAKGAEEILMIYVENQTRALHRAKAIRRERR